MDVTLITKLTAAGAMGVSIYTIKKVYDLLKNEQKKEVPRPTFIKAIRISMIFAVVMTLLSLGIEYARTLIDPQIKDLESDFETIKNENYYSTDKNGNPKEIKLEFNGNNYNLSDPFPKERFKENELILKESKKRYIVINKNLNDSIIFGHIQNTEIKNKTEILFSNNKDKFFTCKKLNTLELSCENLKCLELNCKNVKNLGLYYTPNEFYNLIDHKIKPDINQAIKYLIKFINIEDIENDSQKENALKLLVQPKFLRKLNRANYKTIIKKLQFEKIRTSPYNLYELAQIYRNRAYETWNEDNKQNDLDNYKRYLIKYVEYYESNDWIRKSNRQKELKWYKDSKAILKEN